MSDWTARPVVLPHGVTVAIRRSGPTWTWEAVRARGGLNGGRQRLGGGEEIAESVAVAAAYAWAVREGYDG